MEGSQDEVVRYMRLLEAEFQISDERTSVRQLKDWAVNLARGGADVLASSGMMNDLDKQGDRQVDTGTYDGGKLERLRKNGEALHRQMRRLEVTSGAYRHIAHSAGLCPFAGS